MTIYFFFGLLLPITNLKLSSIVGLPPPLHSSPFCRDAEPVLFAIQRGDVMVVNELATSAAHRLLKENKDGWIPLHDAAFCGQTECMKILLKGMTPPKAFLLVSKHVAAPL